MSALTAAQIPCCLCGALIFPNEANQCAACLAQEFDLQGHIQRGPGGADHSTVHQCRQCRRFERKPGCYEAAEPESPGLLAICLKQLPAMSSSSSPRLHLVDASWIWTEPHSMRFRLCLTVRAEMSSVLVEQRCRVELHCAFQQCPECNREATKRTWHAVVQLRQKRPDSDDCPGITRVEEAIGQNKDLRQHVLRLDDASNGGLDFYFLHLSHAQTFVHAIQRLAPLRVHTAVQQVSTNVHNHTAHMKHTLTCDMAPLWQYDLVYVAPTSSTRHLAGRLWLVDHVGEASWRWIDVSAASSASNSLVHVSSTVYTRLQNENNVLRIVGTPQRWQAYTVLDVEEPFEHGGRQPPDDNIGELQYRADVHVVSNKTNAMHTAVASYLAPHLEAGDTVWGYDVAVGAMIEEWDVKTDFVRHYVLPDVVLVKKTMENDEDDMQKLRAHEGDGERDDGPSSNNGRKKKNSKRKDRKKRKENKRMRELEQRAERMGLLGESDGGFLDEGDDADLEADLAALEMGPDYDDVLRGDGAR